MLLVKIKPTMIANGIATVPRKGVSLSDADIGTEVAVWLTDHEGVKSALTTLYRLVAFEEVEMPLASDSSRTKPGFRLSLEPSGRRLQRQILTDDLESYRDSLGAGGIERLGKLHKDRRDRVLRMSPAEASFLLEHFEQ